MSYANGTQFYNLPQTVGTDKRDWFDTNSAFAAVDAALHAAATGQAADAEAISTINASLATDEANIAALQTASTSQAASISTLQTAVTAQATQIADVRQDAEDMITANNEGAAATSTKAYNIGERFIYNDVLYKATAPIAIGDTIVPNTNCEATNVDTELTQLNNDLAEVNSALTNKQNKTWTQLCYSSSTTGESFTVDWSEYNEVLVCVCNSTGGCVASSIIPISLLANINTVYAEYANSTIWGSARFTTNQIVLQQYGGSNVLCYAR